MKILYIHNTPIDSTKANLIQVLSMCESFSRNGVNILLLLPAHNSEILNASEYIVNRYGVDVSFDLLFYQQSSLRRKLDKYLINAKIKEIMKEVDIDYIFSRIPVFVLAALKENIMVIYESHSNKLHNRYKFIDWIWRRRIISSTKDNNFKLFITISNNLLKFWRLQGVSNKKLLALHDGVNVEEYEIKEDKTSIRKILNFPLNKKIFLYAGSLYPDREIENILLLAQRLPQYFFYVVGGPDNNKKHYQNLSSKMRLTNINFIGQIPHSFMPMYLKSADVLLALWSDKVPTINYCSPLKLFEYMASGTTIVAHNFPTIREVLRHDSNALLVQYGDLDDLVRQASLALKENNYGTLAKKDAVNYTWARRVEKILQALPGCNDK